MIWKKMKKITKRKKLKKKIDKLKKRERKILVNKSFWHEFYCYFGSFE